MTSVAVSLIFIIIAFILFFVLSFKGVNLFAVVLLCAAVVSLATEGGLASIFTAFLPTMANTLSSLFLMYTIGGAFGFVLMDSGLGSSIAYSLIGKFGKKNVSIILFVITCLLVAGGVQSYQFAILAIALPILKEANLPKKVALAAMSAGGGSVVYGCLVGMPTALNVAPTTFLGTTTAAGLPISLICSAFEIVFVVLYLRWLTKRCYEKKEGFVAAPDDVIIENDEGGKNLPEAWKGYICIAAVIGLSLLFQYGLKVTATAAVVYGMFCGIVICFLLVGKRFLPHLLKTCVNGFTSCISPIVLICMVVGYGAVVQQTAGFSWIVSKVLSMNMHPYLLAFLAVNILSGLCANGVAGVTLFMGTFGDQLAANSAINLGALHRICTIAGSGFDSLPHNGAIAFQLSVFKLNYKEGYFQQFMCSVVVNVLAGLLATILAIALF